MSGEDNETLKCAHEALASIVMGYCACIHAALDEMKSGKVLRLMQEMHRIIRKHTRIHHNLKALALREELYISADMRDRVRKDLGGKPAMMRWKVRKRFAGIDVKSRDAHSPQFILDRIERRKQLAQESTWVRKNRSVPKTDRFGHFRLAVIPTGSVERSNNPKVKTRRVNSARDTSIKFQPIELEANDLMNTLPYTLAYDVPPQTEAQPIGHAPPIDRWPI